MARKLLGMLVVGMVSLGLTGASAHAGDEALQKELLALNRLTGNEPMSGALQGLLDNNDHAKKLLQFALPAAKNKEMSYNAAMVLALTAAKMKDMKTSEVYFRVCMDKAAKLQSFEKLFQSYKTLSDLYYNYKQYADATRICKELLTLNTDDGKDRLVIGTMSSRKDEIEFREEREGFDAARRLRPYIQETRVKATAKQGKFDEAIALVDAMLKRNDDWIDQHLKGWVLKEAGKLQDAADIYESVIKQVAEDDRLKSKQKDAYIEQFRYEVSNIYVELKKIDRATEHLEYLVKKHPNDPAFHNDLGFIWADNDLKLGEAEKLIRKAIDLDRELRKKQQDYDPKTDRDNGAYLDSLGWVLFKQKKNKEAKEWLLKAVEDKAAQHIEIFDHLGDVLVALGEREAAIRAYEDGLKNVTESRRDQERKAAVEKKLANLKRSK